MLFVVDIETTGLDHDCDHILEVAILALKNNEIHDSFSCAVKPPGGWFQQMNDFVREMHTESGLIVDVAETQNTLLGVDGLAAKFVTEHAKGEPATMVGSSIHFDRRFIRAQMPALDAAFHYRMLDISSVKIMVEQNWPDLVHPRVVNKAHRAYEDARESLAEYNHYRDQLNPRRWKGRGAPV